MQNLRIWLANHSITAKTASSAWLFLVGLFYADADFHAYVLGAYNGLPKGIHAFMSAVVIPALIFWRTQKRTTVEAQVIPGSEATAKATATVAKEGR